MLHPRDDQVGDVGSMVWNPAHFDVTSGGGDVVRNVVPGVRVQADAQNLQVQVLVDGGDQGGKFRAGVLD
jgi:hypothetical protein